MAARGSSQVQPEPTSGPSDPPGSPDHSAPPADPDNSGSYYFIRYHPSSGLEDVTIPIESGPELCAFEDEDSAAGPYDGPIPPWEPFPTLQDFEFAEFAAKAELKNAHIDELLLKMRSSWASDVHITMRNAANVREAWDQVASIYPKFAKKEFSVSYESATTGGCGEGSRSCKRL
ncbi:hypothetical protein BOTBODRAFT_42183 [Botryobasidium botryosum FD-172 SS1]|uniref:Uncharacterized protein n=1 Tax=Botryobasidium botryosum (strain FD-172 SS1) TaxID=930990 RepID=A0A067N3Z4_BOTB1|nr:hypothetical protein BOTBODRAFT_42183 [Botryobasidium botryosum FD-172 SS1]